MSCEEDAEIVQCDLDKLNEWANEWQMQYNLDKCEVIHFSGKNWKADYYLNGHKLGDVTKNFSGYAKHDFPFVNPC